KGRCYRDVIREGVRMEDVPEDEVEQFTHVADRTCTHCYRFDPQALPDESHLCFVCFASGLVRFSSGTYTGESMLLYLDRDGYDGQECNVRDKSLFERIRKCVRDTEEHRYDKDVLFYDS